MRFVVTFRPAPRSDGIRNLRRLLKAAKRQFGLIATDARATADQSTADPHKGISAPARNEIADGDAS
jgi:hypothetical protein